MSAAAGLGLGAAILALFLITGRIPNGHGSVFTNRKTDPAPYWFGFGLYAFALLVAALIVAVRAGRAA